MSSIPTQYQTLPGFKTVYSETELRVAIAVAEVLIANNLAESGSTLPSGAATSELQTTGNNYLQTIATNTELATPPTILTACNTVSTSGNNTIIAAPGAGLYIYITDLLIQNLSTTATTITVVDSANRLQVLGQNQGDGISKTYPVGRELKLATNQPLILNLSGANLVGYTFEYYIGS